MKCCKCGHDPNQGTVGTKELADMLGVKVKTVIQSLYINGHYKGYEPTIRSMAEYKSEYRWERIGY